MTQVDSGLNSFRWLGESGVRQDIMPLALTLFAIHLKYGSQFTWNMDCGG